MARTRDPGTGSVLPRRDRHHHHEQQPQHHHETDPDHNADPPPDPHPHPDPDPVGSRLLKLRQAALHATPDALELYRKDWCSLQSSSDPAKSALEDHDVYESTIEPIAEIFQERYLERSRSRDIQGHFSALSKESHRWFPALQGVRYYALFGAEGCSRTFLDGLRRLEQMRRPREDDADEEEEERGLTFAQAWWLLQEARIGRVNAIKLGRGISKDDSWRPVDCKVASDLATERFDMRPRGKRAKTLEGHDRKGHGKDSSGMDEEHENDVVDGEHDGHGEHDRTPERPRRAVPLTPSRRLHPSTSPGREPPIPLRDAPSPRLDWSRDFGDVTLEDVPSGCHAPSELWSVTTPTLDDMDFQLPAPAPISDDSDHIGLRPYPDPALKMPPRVIKRVKLAAFRSTDHSPGAVSAFRDQHFTDRPCTDHLALAHQFLVPFSPVLVPLANGPDIIVVHDTTTAVDSSPSYVVVLLPPTDPLSWAVVHLDFTDETKATLVIYVDGASANTLTPADNLTPCQIKDLLQSLPDHRFSPGFLACVDAIPLEECKVKKLPGTCDLETQNLAESFLQALAVATFIIANIEIPPKIFLWAWVGALSFISAQRTTLSELQASVELPNLGAPEQRRTISTVAQGLKVDIQTLDIELNQWESNVELQQTQISALGSFVRHLELLRECCSSEYILPSASALEPWTLAEIDRSIDAHQNTLNCLHPANSLRKPLQEELKILKERKRLGLAEEGNEHTERLNAISELQSWIHLSCGHANTERQRRIHLRDSMVMSLRIRMEKCQDRLAELTRRDEV